MNGKHIFGLVMLITLGLFIAFTSVKKNESAEISPDQLNKKILEWCLWVLNPLYVFYLGQYRDMK